jgi:adenylate cyclase class 2
VAYEVENKYRVTNLEAAAQKMIEAGAEFESEIEQTDTYFNHPQRDFAQTDEALRLRCVADQIHVTYKGPKIDRATKTRVELELPLASGTDFFAQYQELLELLSFRPVLAVKKRRRLGHLTWQGFSVEVCLDEVANLGSFVELEIVTDEQGLEQAQSRVKQLAAKLHLGEPERRSYLEMLLEQ